MTTLGVRQPGSRVNVESDMMAKYVERLIDVSRGGGSGETT
jgi:riboflavin synthase alpha subunit